MEVGCTGMETSALMEAAAKVNYGKKQARTNAESVTTRPPVISRAASS
jgi:hypothetical protein